MENLIDQAASKFISFDIVIAAGAIWIAILIFNRLMPAKYIDSAIYQRVQPVIPEVLGIAITFVPGLLPETKFMSTIIGHIALGLWIGLLSSKAYKVISQSIMGQDEMINGTATQRAEKLAPKADPAPQV